MFKWPSFYYFLEFQCKILNSYAKMVKILNCYLDAKKSYGSLSKGAIFLAISLYIIGCWQKLRIFILSVVG